MCGIAGYIGKRNAVKVILAGLKKLQYRGYDSVGISIMDEGKVKTIKAVGKISNLEKKLIRLNLKGNLGIGHTRWATCGKVNLANAHPQSDCSRKIFLVHNGIVENYLELKRKLEKLGHQFSSQTDTEVLAHLIEEELIKNPGIKLEKATELALQRVIGTYALVIISEYQPDKLIVATCSSPLVIGLGKKEYFVASDPLAIVSRTKKVIYLKDGHIGVITPYGCQIYFKKKLVKQDIHSLDFDELKVSKKQFPYFMAKEIFEQPVSIENSITGRIDLKNCNSKLGGIEDVLDKLAKIEQLIIIGCGSAYLAGLFGEYFLEEYSNISCHSYLASEFRYRNPVLNQNTAFLFISQSGETADTLAVLREVKKKNILSLGIVNVVGSSIARETDAGIYNHCGPEIGVASTKAFTSQLTILILLGILLGRQRKLSKKIACRILTELKNLPGLIKQVLQQSSYLKRLAKKYLKYDNFLFIGRKYNYPIAMEGALKLKEISYVHAEGYPSGEMKHGPIAMIDKGFPTVAICPKDSVYSKTISNILEIKTRSGKVIAVATKGDRKIKKIVDDVIYVPKIFEPIQPILEVIPLQLFAYYFSVLKGLDPDKPRNLAKSVTVE